MRCMQTKVQKCKKVCNHFAIVASAAKTARLFRAKDRVRVRLLARSGERRSVWQPSGNACAGRAACVCA